jgi:branched-chain amino acid transport system ATP-binding protein
VNEPIFEVRNLSKFFGGLMANYDISFKVMQGQIKGLIGPNGSGKTTLLNIVSGVYPATQGEIIFKGQTITKLPSYKRAALGIGRTFQDTKLFSLDLTVLQNLMVGHHVKTRTGMLDVFIPWSNIETEQKHCIEVAEKYLEMIGLLPKATWSIDSLTWQDMRLCGIARALAMEPELLLLDEPAAGLNQTEADELVKTIRKLRNELGLTIILVEHNMKVVMAVCDDIVVINHGQILAEGTPEEIRNNPDVINTYLGV